MVKMVPVGTTEVPVKELKMDQEGNKMDVSLWRQHADANITIGQHIELENMVIRKEQQQHGQLYL